LIKVYHFRNSQVVLSQTVSVTFRNSLAGKVTKLGHPKPDFWQNVWRGGSESNRIFSSINKSLSCHS